VDAIVDWYSNSWDSPPRSLLYVPKTMTRRMKPGPIDDLRPIPVTAWWFIPQWCTDKLCYAFPAKLELCLANDRPSISNQLFEVADCSVLKSLCMANWMDVPWTPGEDERDLHRFLTICPKLKCLAFTNTMSCDFFELTGCTDCKRAIKTRIKRSRDEIVARWGNGLLYKFRS
jgi:hypothetical protein